ncbi:MAG TPA: type II secretion system F family protein [Burkholderiales bacterium]|nr:type II secretion system F family protein [Burkholderiales bacterium]
MAFFLYKGRNSRGEAVQGRIEGADSVAIADQLLNTGITPVDIRPARASPELRVDALLARLRERVTPTDVMLMSRQLYTLLRAGVPIMRALSGLQESATNPALARVLQEVRGDLESGKELSAALRRHPQVFSAFFVAMVRVGEMTGHLEEVFLRLAQHTEFDIEMRGRVKSALRYPTFVIAAMIAALLIVNIWVIPVFAQLYEGFHAQLPPLTRALIAFSNFTIGYWPLLAASAIAAGVGFRLWVATPRGRYVWDRTKLRFPIAGKILVKATLARFARSFALSVRSGVPLVQALSVVARVVENEYIGSRIEQMRDGVERGESILRTAIATGVFSPVVLQMVNVGEETGALDELMLEIAGMYERDVEYDLKNLASQIEPILIVCLAVLVLILALGVLTPIWGLGKAMIHGR